jgi:branched-chain amino acid transport system ATP-binding protein
LTVSLRINNVVVCYGKARAIDGITFDIGQRNFIGLIGRNGAGKTSLLRAIFGLVKIDSGEIWFQDIKVSNLAPYERVRLGMALVPEGRELLAKMTVMENLEMGAYLQTKKNIRQLLNEVFNYFPILLDRRTQKAGTLSGGEQQMLAIGRSLMCRPTLLIMDEPSLGLSPLIIQNLAEIFTEIHRSGKSIFLVEQNANLALNLTEKCLVLEDGKIMHYGSKEELLFNQSVREAFLGA